MLGGEIESLRLNQTSSNLESLLLRCFSTDLDEIHDGTKDFFALFKMAPSAIVYLFSLRNDILTKLGVKLK